MDRNGNPKARRPPGSAPRPLGRSLDRGGYQVIKKWLSYREQTILGRPLRLEEVQEVTAMVRRIAAILLLGPALDASFAVVRREARPAPPHRPSCWPERYSYSHMSRHGKLDGMQLIGAMLDPLMRPRIEAEDA